MTSPARPVQPDSANPSTDGAAEAARYALLRRLAPSMRHHLVVNLQPIGMIYEVMDRRLRAPEPDLAEVHESAQKINGFARAALTASLDVITWLAPQEDALTTATDGVRECLGLLATSLTFRGYALRNEVTPQPNEVRRSAMRGVLTAALIHMTDENSSPAELELKANSREGALELALTFRPREGEAAFSPEPAYRALAWSDVQALAASESVQASREGRQQIVLTIPWASGA